MGTNPGVVFREIFFSIGMCYENGLGVEINFKLAFEYYTKSRNVLYPPGIHALGRCYEEGIGVEVNPIEARRLYELAMEKENINAEIQFIEYPQDTNIIRMNNKRKYETLS